MSWVKLDDQFPTHPKIVAAGGDAAWLHVCALCYCATHLTDGLLPKGMVDRISDRKTPRKLAARLVEVGAWVDRGDSYELHGYLDYNPSREHVETERRKAAERRTKGGRASRERRPTNTSPDPTPPELPAVVEDSRGEPFEHDFDQIWKRYPRKVDRLQALAQYQARRREGAPHAALLAAVEFYAEASDGQDRQFVKHGATFLGKRGAWAEWVNGPPLDSLSNGALGARQPRAPEPPSGPSFVANHEQSRSYGQSRPCPLGVEECRDGLVDRMVEGRKVAVRHECQAVSA